MREAGAYEPVALELKWQGLWHDANVTDTPGPSAERPDTYVFVTPPFTSGAAHMGHVRSYTIGDACARFRRAQGDSVLFTLGFDAFGLPSELGAIEEGTSPDQWVDRCRETMQGQFTRLGLSFDWSRSFVSSDPDVYRWSQWLFLKLLEDGLVYQRDGQVEWCESCGTVLANLQVIDGCCWRCDNPVELIRRTQWYLRRSAYNTENYDRLSGLTEWNNTALAAQRATLGPVEGVELEAKGFDGSSLTVFTTLPEAIAEAEFILISPSHPELAAWTSGDVDIENELESRRQAGGRRDERRDAYALVLETGAFAQVPGVEEPLPVLVSPSVDARVGPTAMLGIPARDRTDKALSEQVKQKSPTLGWRTKATAPDPQPSIRYRATDFTISRQRAWGAPIPLVHCEQCGTVPVPLSDLPVRLPEDLLAAGPGAGLDRFPDFVECACPQCGGKGRRETDTLDCHLDAAWTVFPLAVPTADRANQLFDHPELSRWLPVTQMVQGADTGTFILNMRLVSKALRDAGVIDFLPDGEPFDASLMHEMVQLDGRKMSKHLGNVVAPQDLVEQYGSDSVRFAMLYAAAPGKSFSWNEHPLKYCASFLSGLWAYAAPHLSAGPPPSSFAEIDTSDRLRSRVALWSATAIKRITAHYEALEMHQATRNLMRFSTRIQDFEKRAQAQRGALEEADQAAVNTALLSLIQMLAPISPHIAEELWHLAGHDDFIGMAAWPEPFEPEPQPNGRTRRPKAEHANA